MPDILVKTVGRKKSVEPQPVPQPEPEDKERKPMAIQIRGDSAWKSWVERLSRFDDRPVALLVERALREYAERAKFPELPPKR
jgi:hypothetical protein